MIEIEQKYIRVNTPLYVMEYFYDDVLNRINKNIYEHDKLYGPKEFFLQVFKVDIKIDYPNDILKKLESDISEFISVFHFFWEENDVIFDNRKEGYFYRYNLYNKFRDAYSEGMYDLLNALFLLSIGSPVQSTTLVRRAFEGLINGVYSITKENDGNTGKGENIKFIYIINSIFDDNKLNKMFEESPGYKNLKDFLEHQLTSLKMKQAYDRIKLKIENNRDKDKVKEDIYFIYERLSDYTHIYERNKNIIDKELRAIHAHEPSFDKFDEPNDLFNITCALYIPFLFVGIELLHSNEEITDKEYGEIEERFVN